MSNPLPDDAIRVRDRRDPHQFTVHNLLIDEWFPIISSNGYSLYSLFCRMAVKGEERCWPGLRMIVKHLGMGASTVSEYARLLAWCELVYILPGAAGGRQTSDYYLLDVPAVTGERLQAIQAAVSADMARLAAEREKEAKKLEAGGLKAAAVKVREKNGSAFHRTVLRRLKKWEPIQAHWGDDRPTPTIIPAGQLPLFGENGGDGAVDNSRIPVDKSADNAAVNGRRDPPVEQRDPAVEVTDPAVESPDPVVEGVIRQQDQNKKQQQSITTIQSNNQQQQEANGRENVAVVVAGILAWMGFVGGVPGGEVPATDELLAWAMYARAEQPGNNPVGLVRAAWRRRNSPPGAWLELARLWLGLDDDGRQELLETAEYSAAYSRSKFYCDPERFSISEQAGNAFMLLWRETDGDCAPAALMPPVGQVVEEGFHADD